MTMPCHRLTGASDWISASMTVRSPFFILPQVLNRARLWHFCQRSGGSGIYATWLSMVWQAAGRLLSRLADIWKFDMGTPIPKKRTPVPKKGTLLPKKGR